MDELFNFTLSNNTKLKLKDHEIGMKTPSLSPDLNVPKV